MPETSRACHTLAALLVAAGFAASAQAAAPDATLYTSYSVDSTLENANWVVCGATSQTGGCYASGTLGPFGHIGAMLEGRPAVSGETVTRQIYVLDVASGSARNGVSLFVYTKKDVVSATDDTVTVTLSHKISLPLVGGSGVKASMAANSSYLYVGTNKSMQAVTVARGTWTVTTIGGFSPPIPVASITSDSYGYITVTFGAPGGTYSGFYVYGPNGTSQGDGGGAQFMLNTSNAVTPVALP
jgi:hypothetical protein